MQKPHFIPKTRRGFISSSVHPVANTCLGPVATSLNFTPLLPPSNPRSTPSPPSSPSVFPWIRFRAFREHAFAFCENWYPPRWKLCGAARVDPVSSRVTDGRRRESTGAKIIQMRYRIGGKRVSTDGALFLRPFRDITSLISAATDQDACAIDNLEWIKESWRLITTG